jgi:two-component system NtrC family sensor kinase
VEGAPGRSYEGSGIGLALVREIAELHAGSIDVSSVQSQGTTFTVSIPTGADHLPSERIVAAPEGGAQPTTSLTRLGTLLGATLGARDAEAQGEGEREAETQAEAGAERASANAGRILLADDNADMRNYVLRLLEPYFDVRAVSDGKAALEQARKDPPDLVLSDVMMPVMDGVALVAALRRDPVTHTIPVVLLSARAGEEAVVAGLETGADDYLVKPFSARELLGRVRAHLAMARMRKEAENAMRELAETRAALVSELERKNGELEAAYHDLQRAQAQLVQSAKMASLGELVAGVAHAINNPLAFALGHLDTVQRCLRRTEGRLGAALTEELLPDWRRASDRLREIQSGLDRIRDLVLRLRTFSRLDEGEQKIVSIKESVESVLMILEHRLHERVTVVTDFCEPDQVLCYPSLINQALLNLVSNAADAIAEHGSVKLSTHTEGTDYVISVADTGSGIPESIRDRVIEPFFTTKPVGEGTGLGLPITYSIAKKHGGDLELHAGPEGGTVAVLRFPLAPAERAPN